MTFSPEALKDDGRKPSEVGYKRAPRVEEKSDLNVPTRQKVRKKVMGSQKEGNGGWSDVL